MVFALERIPEGGCILADEVGLGKTIEAGLIIAQLLAEGAERILILVPKPLLGQWQNELYGLFGIVAQEGEAFDGAGVFIVGREFAGSERGSEMLLQCAPFDLCIIDEAHEIFAGIHKRYDRHGHYRDNTKQAIMAHRVRTFLRDTPKLLLTATPIQNSLAELWGLVQYVEPTGTLLGNIATFRALFCKGDDRTLVPEQADELRRRLENVVKRTLRRQAQEFLERPFVDRRAKLHEYRMSPEERTLYDEVTGYLLDPDTCAFSGGRHFLLIGFHRRMASSRPALASSLDKVANRLEAMLEVAMNARAERPESPAVAEAEPGSAPGHQFEFDLEDTDFFQELYDESSGDNEPGTADPRMIPLFPVQKVRDELERVNDFAHRARTIAHDSKAAVLLEAVAETRRRAERGQGSGKVVIFTESLVTQDYLREQLIASGVPDDEITLFRGTNDSARAIQALQRWQAKFEKSGQSRPSRSVAVRLALVHEFETRSQVFIATEAGAKGLNLQVCETVINYDLPWNPQRIEQRIGRCHRYNQTRDVTVINFIAADNEADRLLFDILSTKLDLFGTVFDASDAVLHQATTAATEPLTMALGSSIDQRIRRIYERARSRDEIGAEMAALRDEVGRERQAFEDVMSRTYGLLERSVAETAPAETAAKNVADVAVLLVAVSQRRRQRSQWYRSRHGAGWDGDERSAHFDRTRAREFSGVVQEVIEDEAVVVEENSGGETGGDGGTSRRPAQSQT